MWLSKKQNLVKMLNIGSKFTALSLEVEFVIALRYKLHIFRVPLKVPTDMFYDNEAVFKKKSTP